MLAILVKNDYSALFFKFSHINMPRKHKKEVRTSVSSGSCENSKRSECKIPLPRNLRQISRHQVIQPRKFASSKIASAPCIPHTMATSSEKPLSKYVTLISSDGFEFVVLREAACKSGTIKKMLNPKSES